MSCPCSIPYVYFLTYIIVFACTFIPHHFSSEDARKFITFAVCGPTTEKQPPWRGGGHGQPAFAWSDKREFEEIIHVGIPARFDFNWIEITKKGQPSVK